MSKKFNLSELLSQRSRELQEKTSKEQKEEKGKIVMVDVYDLVPSKDNFYHVDDSLKRSIELVGVLQPLLVNKPENGKYKVIAGHRRRLAVLSLVNEGKEERRYLPCVFKKEDIRDRLAIIMANRFRDKTDWEKMMEVVEAEELAKELKREYKLDGRTRELLSDITGVTEGQLGRYKAIYNNLIPQLMKEFKENKILVSVAVEVSQMEPEWQQKVLEHLLKYGVLSLPDVREWKKQEEAAKQIQGQMSFLAEGIEIESVQEVAVQEVDHKQDEEIGEDTTPQSNKWSVDVNQKEVQKMPEQHYNGEQKTRQEQQQEKKEENILNDEEAREYELEISPVQYHEIVSGKLPFFLLKKGSYEMGEYISLFESKDGKKTGKQIDIKVQRIWECWDGLKDNYCIIGFTVWKTREGKTMERKRGK